MFLAKRKRRLDSLEAAQGAPREPRRDSRGERSPWLPLETPLLIATGEAIPLRGLEGVPGLPGAPQENKLTTVI